MQKHDDYHGFCLPTVPTFVGTLVLSLELDSR